jgi:CHAT domain-containing protein
VFIKLTRFVTPLSAQLEDGKRVRDFFFAGACSVLAAHRAIESESATALSVATFESRALSRAESRRHAQIAMLEGRLGKGRWRHPFYWVSHARFGNPPR